MAGSTPLRRSLKPAALRTPGPLDAGQYHGPVHRPVPPSEMATATRGQGLFGVISRVVVRWPWLVIAAWIGLAAGLTQVFPPLAELAQRAPNQILPADAPSLVANNQMMEAFKEGGSENILLVVLTDDKGLSAADEAVYRDLVTKLKADKTGVAAVQEFVSIPPLKEVLGSKDGKAWLVPVSLSEPLGTPQANETTRRLIDLVRATVAGSQMKAYLTGPAATLSDIMDIGERDRVRIESVTVLALLAILLMVYRNPLTIMLPLITIGVSLVVAQAVVAGLGVAGLGVSTQTIVLLSAMMAGAGTDYAVFLISRYHDYLRLGATSDEAVPQALLSVGKVIAASAATVAVTFLGMIFTKLTVFSTVGVALAVAICVGCAGALTFLPALLVLVGRRGWAKPRRDLTSRFWKRSGIRIVRKPVPHLVGSLAILALLAGSASLAKYNYDDRKTLPAETESIHGYAVIGEHYPVNASLPQYLLVHSPHDLRTAKMLADMEQMAFRVSQVPDVDIIRGITRPTGESLEQTKLSFQAGEVGSKLGEASTLINSHDAELNLLSNGAKQVADVLGQLETQLNQGIATVSGLLASPPTAGQLPALGPGQPPVVQNHLGGNTGLQQLDLANKLLDAVHALGKSLGIQVADASSALENNPACDADPVCRANREQLQKNPTAKSLLDQMAALARQLQNTAGSQILGPPANLGATDPYLGPGKEKTPGTSGSSGASGSPGSSGATRNPSPAPGAAAASDALGQMLQAAGINGPASLQAQLDQLSQGAAMLAAASRQLADGVQLIVGQTKQLGAGLEQASQFLLEMKHEATTPAMAGFNVPRQILSSEDFRKAAGIFISPDGHTARYLVQTKLNPFSSEAMDQVNAMLAAAQSAQPNTTLSDATITMTGFSVTLRDTRDYYYHDLRLIVTTTILVVLSILIVLLRALVAPLYLIVSVILSYLSALGLGVLMTKALHQELHWSVPGLTFIILVAVGADYNLLLISRIRDESPHGIKSGVIRTVTQTGGVITAAGLIFAASMLGLQFSSITTLFQVGFIIGVGILLDTFLVRTITVPATAVLVGKANWWPSKWKPPAPTRPARPPEPEAEPATAVVPQ